MNQKQNHRLFHLVLNKLRVYNIQNKHILVGVSGGLDSMALLTCLTGVRHILGLKISVVHIYHGSTEPKQKAFQKRAFKLVQQFCQKNHLPFYANNPSLAVDGVSPEHPSKTHDIGGIEGFAQLDPKADEAQMRAFRYKLFSQYFRQAKADHLALAHTADDLLETRLLRLIRGTGPIGIRAMGFKDDSRIRPFIEASRFVIKDYAKQRALHWEEDPSNQSSEYSFRNWIRHQWLPLLEQKQAGATTALARSLKLLANAHKDSYSENKQMLAHQLWQMGIKNYSANHIKELVRQLGRKRQKSFSFNLLGHLWKVSPQPQGLLAQNEEGLSAQKKEGLLAHQKEVTLEQLPAVAEHIKSLLKKPQLILLNGDFGVGKTTFTYHLLRGLVGPSFLPSQGVVSPGFAVQHVYPSPYGSIYHVDLCRLKDSDDLESTGFWDVFAGEAKTYLVIIEWAERLDLKLLPTSWNYIALQFKFGNKPNTRRIHIKKEAGYV